MTDTMIKLVVWLAVAVHMTVAIITWRRRGGPPLVPLVNLIVGITILGYWVQQWYGYLTRGIQWDWIDQLVPLYALVVVILAGLALSGRHPGTTLNRVLFGVDAIVLLGFAILFSLLKFDRML